MKQTLFSDGKRDAFMMSPSH